MEAEVPLSCSEEQATRSYPEEGEYSPLLHIIFLVETINFVARVYCSELLK
jgi:hypothetical protein